MTAPNDDRLITGERIDHVLRQDEQERAARRERENAQRDEAMFDRYLGQSFGIEPEHAPSPTPDPNRDRDLHDGARRSAGGGDDELLAAYLTQNFPGR